MICLFAVTRFVSHLTSLGAKVTQTFGNNHQHAPGCGNFVLLPIDAMCVMECTFTKLHECVESSVPSQPYCSVRSRFNYTNAITSEQIPNRAVLFNVLSRLCRGKERERVHRLLSLSDNATPLSLYFFFTAQQSCPPSPLPGVVYDAFY